MYDGLIDLRSDTVTRPTSEMRRAMADAEVGDDVFGDDPTINALQEAAAARLGKEAGLYVPTGSMGNQVALGALTRPGDEVLCHTDAHFLHYEGGSPAVHLGLILRQLPGEGGTIRANEVGAAIRGGNDHNPRTAVVAIENTHNAAGGRIFPIDEARSIAKVCQERDAGVHIDGARIFNAEVATGTPAAEWASCADTVTFCFSKGLGAPVGSMVCSTREVITEGRRLRKRLGGGMRQAGVLAAAAQVALDTGVERLAEDHANARRLAEGLLELHPDAVDLASVETNMVYLDLRPFSKPGAQVSDGLRQRGVLTLGSTGDAMRLVTHRDVDAADIVRALDALRTVLTESD
ncbi:MAG: aminotransferase class I/II-fold pyridoxal phosphate-dependent enzyme [Actinomycetota bacterium]|nr:aminotransferase class I/II-fold pyridoxal phosphate-dependent enzyme [Actinomycetota bacterium]